MPGSPTPAAARFRVQQLRSPYTGSPFAGNGTLSAPASIAIDAPGNIWIANSGNSSITELTAAGTFTQQVSTGSSKPVRTSIRAMSSQSHRSYIA